MAITLQERANLITLYSTPCRKYHTWTHVEFCLRTARDILNVSSLPLDLELAICYHDAIYDPYSKTNEEDSFALINFRPQDRREHYNINTIKNCIMATKNHFAELDIEDEHEKSRVLFFLDLDMAVLGTEQNYYKNFYANKVREEYFATSTADYVEGRINFLNSVLSQEKIFRTIEFSSLEAAARKNIENEIKELSFPKTRRVV